MMKGKKPSKARRAKTPVPSPLQGAASEFYPESGVVTPYEVAPGIFVGTDECARHYSWFETMAGSGVPIKFILSCITPASRSAAPVQYGHEIELELDGHVQDSQLLSQDAWQQCLATVLAVRRRHGTSHAGVLLHSPDGGATAFLIAVAVAMAVDDPRTVLSNVRAGLKACTAPWLGGPEYRVSDVIVIGGLAVRAKHHTPPRIEVIAKRLV